MACKHSFATEAVTCGAQEHHLQAYLGYANVRSTRRYARLADERLESIVGRRRKDDR